MLIPVALSPRRQRQSFDRKRSIIRQRAKRANEENVKRVFLQASKSTPVSVYQVNEEVLVLKLKHTNNRVTKRHSVVQGVIIKRNQNVSKYKVQYQTSASALPQQKWFSVADITSVTHSKKKRERAHNQSVNMNRELFVLAKSHTDHLASSF